MADDKFDGAFVIRVRVAIILSVLTIAATILDFFWINYRTNYWFYIWFNDWSSDRFYLWFNYRTNYWFYFFWLNDWTNYWFYIGFNKRSMVCTSRRRGA